ncbi:unnamed protein product, partial [Rotaria socialis]
MADKLNSDEATIEKPTSTTRSP